MPTPVGSGPRIEDEIVRLRKQLDELSRKAPRHPCCVVRLTGDATLTGAVNTNAQQLWTPPTGEDPDAMFTPGAAGVPCFITIDRTGYYELHYHSTATGLDGANTHASKIMLNGTNINTNPVASAAMNFTNQGGDGAPLDAKAPHRWLVNGDKIYWQNWVSVTATLRAAVFNVPTQITVRYLGQR